VILLPFVLLFGQLFVIFQTFNVIFLTLSTHALKLCPSVPSITYEHGHLGQLVLRDFPWNKKMPLLLFEKDLLKNHLPVELDNTLQE